MNDKWPLMPRVVCTLTVSSRLSNKNIDTRYFYSPSFTWKLLQAQGPKGVRKKEASNKKKSRTFGVKFVTSLRRSRQTQFISCWLREENIREGRRSSNYYDVCVVGHWANASTYLIRLVVGLQKKSFSFLTFNYVIENHQHPLLHGYVTPHSNDQTQTNKSWFLYY